MRAMELGWCVVLGVVLGAGFLGAAESQPEVVIAEGERFAPQDDRGWKLTPQRDSYACHTYGGMWVTHGAVLGAPADSEGSIAVQKVRIPAAGSYRVWSKYQAPPYFNYLHKIEIVQKGKTVFSHVYGKRGTERLWSFSGTSNELWWPWGVDHDAAESPKATAKLAAGDAEIRMTTMKNPEPAGDRFVDFVVLTTNPADDYVGFKPYRVGTPFANEALAATQLFMRFQNTTKEPAQLTISRRGHFQPNYGSAKMQGPEQPVPAGKWSGWFNIGPFCRLVHNETLRMELPGSGSVKVQFARDARGRDVVGDMTLSSGDVVVIPLEITWKKDARIRTSAEHAQDVIRLAKTQWRTANRGKKPREILFYGAFRGDAPWVDELKDSLGYNTLLPDKYDHAPIDGYHQHARNAKAIEAYAQKIPDRSKFRVLSFGDEISLGRIKYDDPEMVKRFRAWLKRKKVTREELGVAPESAVLVGEGTSPAAWFTQLFNEEERFAYYRHLTAVARKAIGPQVLTGANFSPHHLALHYGPVYKWVDLFKHNGMSMFWSEDYIFSVPEVPEIISWVCAEMRCGVKYHGQPIHFYVMPHAPGQEPGDLRRNLFACIGNGVRHIDNFWVAPEEGFTENYVAWGQNETFRTLHEGIYDVAEAEPFVVGGKMRPARVAVVLSKATDFHESRLEADVAKDPFLRQCRNAVDSRQRHQTICRKDQQMLYLALRRAGHAVELITEDDIAGGHLKGFNVVYFAGEWIDRNIVDELDRWVAGGGILYATAGIGHRNQFGRPEPAMLKLLGLKSCTTEKKLYIVRTLLELPHAKPIDTITLGDAKIPAIGMRQRLVPADAKVLGTWSDGTAAVTVRKHGRGTVFAVGTLAGNTWMKTGLRNVPFARGGRKNLYNPSGFDPAATSLIRLGVDARNRFPREVVCSHPGVEATVIDHKEHGTLVTLVNWSNAPIEELEVKVKLAATPKSVRSVEQQKEIPASFESGTVTFTTRLKEADFLLLRKK